MPSPHHDQHVTSLPATGSQDGVAGQDDPPIQEPLPGNRNRAGEGDVEDLDELRAMLVTIHRAPARPGEAFAVTVLDGSPYVRPIHLPSRSTPSATAVAFLAGASAWVAVEADLAALAQEHEADIDVVYLFAFSQQARAYGASVAHGPRHLSVTLVHASAENLDAADIRPCDRPAAEAGPAGPDPSPPSTPVPEPVAASTYRLAATVLGPAGDGQPDAVLLDVVLDVRLEAEQAVALLAAARRALQDAHLSRARPGEEAGPTSPQ